MNSLVSTIDGRGHMDVSKRQMKTIRCAVFMQKYHENGLLSLG
jgi:hypothetical protein